MHYGNNKPRYIRYAIYVALIFFVSLLQNSPDALPEIMGARAILVVPLCIVIAMHEREIAAAVFGCFSGVLLDVSSAVDGFNTLCLMAMAVVCSLLISRIMQNNIVTALVLSVCGTALYYVLYILINLLLSGAMLPVSIFVKFYLASFVYTTVFVPLLYFVVKKIFAFYKTVDE